MALSSHHYGVVEAHMETLTKMGLPAAAVEPTTGTLVRAMEASPYAGLDLSTAAASLFKPEVLASATTVARSASARRL